MAVRGRPHRTLTPPEPCRTPGREGVLATDSTLRPDLSRGDTPATRSDRSRAIGWSRGIIRHSDRIRSDQGSGRCRRRGRCRAWCRRPLPVGRARAPPPVLQGSCRQRDYEARQRARELTLGDQELIVARAALDRLRDELYVLACAVEDVERDLGGPTRPVPTISEALAWLLDAARPLCARERADLTPAADRSRP